MFHKQRFTAAIIVGVALLAAPGGWGDGPVVEQQQVVPSHADAAIFFAKYSGLFETYVAKDATLDECVSFLNGRGIYFGLLEVVKRADFTVNDCARVMGQLSLVLSGEAEYRSGKVKLPNGIDSWVVFCHLNNVKYEQGYADLLGVLRKLYNLFLTD